ncbi:rhodanese-like domain-containing protein [Paenibacillus lautus]|uniref:rhodanese-like domain-containing protein n=1 Tax=Paenibacillus lautus TaxID=1401 RepID=UPI0001787E37|nr:rhodanese-like domain-containing protein [Paenibacillus lautus]
MLKHMILMGECFVLIASAALIIFISGLYYRRYVPITGLRFMKCSDLRLAQKECPNLKVLDVRDVSEFMECPRKETINISLGRLPYVWEKELKPDDSVVIVTPKRSDGILAARKLKKAGFTSLFYLQEDCTACNSVQRASMN